MSDEQDDTLSSYSELGDFEIIRGEDVVVEDGPKTTEIYYMLCYNVQDGKWYSADGMIHALNGGKGQVLEGNGQMGHWRDIEEGLEADTDYDNVEILSEFLRGINEGKD